MGHCCQFSLFHWHSLAPRTKLYTRKVASCQRTAPQIARTLLKVVLPSHQFSSSSSPDTPRTKVCTTNSPDARPHFARSTRTISAESCAGTGQITLSPAFRALDTLDLRRGWCGHRTNRTLACISRTRHARSPQRVARAWDKSHSRLHFAHSTRTISVGHQNERFVRRSKSAALFVRDFLQKSSEHTHHAACQAVSRFQPLQTTSAHTPIPM